MADKKEPKIPDKRKKGKFVDLNPKLIDTMRESTGPQSRVDWMIRLGLGNMDELTFYRRAMLNPELANKNPQLRQYVGEVCERLLHMVMSDSMMWNRTLALLTKERRERGNHPAGFAEETEPKITFAKLKRYTK